MNTPLKVFKQRRDLLIKKIQEQYPDTSGSVVFFGAFERTVPPYGRPNVLERDSLSKHSTQEASATFHQESSFYYYTGVQEPASALVIDVKTGKTTLYVPQYGIDRCVWVQASICAERSQAADYGFDAIEFLGEPVKGYIFSPLFDQKSYANLIGYMRKECMQKKSLFTLYDDNNFAYIEQKQICDRIASFFPEFNSVKCDISSLVADMRRTKSKEEIEALYKSINITMMAHEAVVYTVAAGKKERELMAGVEYIFTESGADSAFPSIIASGGNSTVLHYSGSSRTLEDNDLLLVDIGAEYAHYCADLSRTYPVSGQFTERQKEIYQIVLDAYDHVVAQIKPGMYINNKDMPEKSLFHIARTFFKERGVEQFFTHNIGHFVGLDAHDVGDMQEPLRKNDVITIEPGLYLPEESIGVRIEDMYWVVPDGAICLSEDLPRDIDRIEKAVQVSQEGPSEGSGSDGNEDLLDIDMGKIDA